MGERGRTHTSTKRSQRFSRLLSSVAHTPIFRTIIMVVAAAKLSAPLWRLVGQEDFRFFPHTTERDSTVVSSLKCEQPLLALTTFATLRLSHFVISKITTSMAPPSAATIRAVYKCLLIEARALQRQPQFVLRNALRLEQWGSGHFVEARPSGAEQKEAAAAFAAVRSLGHFLTLQERGFTRDIVDGVDIASIIRESFRENAGLQHPQVRTCCWYEVGRRAFEVDGSSCILVVFGQEISDKLDEAIMYVHPTCACMRCSIV